MNNKFNLRLRSYSNIKSRSRSHSNFDANSYLTAIRKLENQSEYDKFIDYCDWCNFNENESI